MPIWRKGRSKNKQPRMSKSNYEKKSTNDCSVGPRGHAAGNESRDRNTGLRRVEPGSEHDYGAQTSADVRPNGPKLSAAIAGNRYRGINVLALLGTDFSDPRWMTYKQAQAQGWQVRGGERSTQIQHWIWEEERVRVGEDGQPVLDSQKKAIKDLVRLERPKVITAA